jgi:5'-methylthioadenosine phosphorylase
MSVAVILGSAFKEPVLGGFELAPVTFRTRLGDVTLRRYPRDDLDAWVLFRHGTPHRYLPHQIPYRAHTLALLEVGCRALLVTSSVGVLDRALPLDQPLLVSDLLMPQNRLPDGSACTMYPKPADDQGHLVLDEGLFSKQLSDRVAALAGATGRPVAGRVVFAYCIGPRTKTAAENEMWARLGAQVNSMTVGPEVVLANEMEIPTATLVVGHKYSLPGVHERLDHAGLALAVKGAWKTLDTLASVFLKEAQPVEFRNRIHRI